MEIQKCFSFFQDISCFTFGYTSFGWKTGKKQKEKRRGAGEQRWRRMEETGEINVCFMTPLDSSTKGTTFTKPGCPFLQLPCNMCAISTDQHTFPTSQEPICSMLDLWAAAQLHSWRWGMCSPAQIEKSKHKTSDT